MKSEVYKLIDDYLKYLKTHGYGSIHSLGNIYSSEGQNAVLEMKKYQLIHFRDPNESQSIVDITLKGNECLEVGFEQYVKNLESKKESSSIHIGHNISGDIQKSRLNINLPNADHKNKIAKIKPKFSIIKILYLLSGVLLCIIAIYEFLVKHLTWH